MENPVSRNGLTMYDPSPESHADRMPITQLKAPTPEQTSDFHLETSRSEFAKSAIPAKPHRKQKHCKSFTSQESICKVTRHHV